MRIFRTVLTALVLALMGLGGLSVAPAGAKRTLPKRIITEDSPGEHQASYNAFKLQGKMEEPQAHGTVLLRRRRSSCSKRRVKVKASHGTTKGTAWTLYFR